MLLALSKKILQRLLGLCEKFEWSSIELFSLYT